MGEAMDALEARLRQRVNLLQDLSEALAAIRVRETAADGSVTVEVDGAGVLTDLEFSNAVWNFAPEEFEEALVRTADAALRAALAERGELITAFNEQIASQVS